MAYLSLGLPACPDGCCVVAADPDLERDVDASTVHARPMFTVETAAPGPGFRCTVEDYDLPDGMFL